MSRCSRSPRPWPRSSWTRQRKLPPWGQVEHTEAMTTTPHLISVPPEPLEVNPHSFPVLTPAQLARISRYGTARTCEPGDVLMAVGSQNPSVFVVVRGQIDVVRMAGD